MPYSQSRGAGMDGVTASTGGAHRPLAQTARRPARSRAGLL